MGWLLCSALHRCNSCWLENEPSDRFVHEKSRQAKVYFSFALCNPRRASNPGLKQSLGGLYFAIQYTLLSDLTALLVLPLHIENCAGWSLRRKSLQLYGGVAVLIHVCWRRVCLFFPETGFASEMDTCRIVFHRRLFVCLFADCLGGPLVGLSQIEWFEFLEEHLLKVIPSKFGLTPRFQALPLAITTSVEQFVITHETERFKSKFAVILEMVWFVSGPWQAKVFLVSVSLNAHERSISNASNCNRTRGAVDIPRVVRARSTPYGVVARRRDAPGFRISGKPVPSFRLTTRPVITRKFRGEASRCYYYWRPSAIWGNSVSSGLPSVDTGVWAECGPDAGCWKTVGDEVLGKSQVH